MHLARFWRHAVMNPMRARAAFPAASLDRIGQAIAAAEKLHRGEIRFVVEAELGTAHLWHEVTPRDRAREVFAKLGVWNTEENNGILVYVLLADRSVEIVADRGIAAVAAAQWQGICRMMEGHFTAGRHEEGALAGVAAVSALLQRHYPAHGGRANELEDRPVVM